MGDRNSPDGGAYGAIEDSESSPVDALSETRLPEGSFRDNEVGEIVTPSAIVKEPAFPIQNLSSSLKLRRSPLGRMSSAVIDINQLPADVAETLRPYDLNGDGKISVTEMVHGAMTQVEQEEKVIFFRRMLIAIFIGWLLTMGAMFGVVYGAIEASKESKVETDNTNKPGATMVTKDNAYVVQTANSDFFVGNDGSAYVRSVTSQQLEATEGEAVNYNVLKTSAATANVTFSSNIPDSLLPELRHITIHSAIGATLSLNVHGALRMPPTISSAGIPHQGALTLLTHIGRIIIDGTSVSCVDDTQAQIFESAGFIVADVEGVAFDGSDQGERRRLLDGIIALYGIFNAVADLATWYNAQKYGNQPPPKLPQNFIMYSRRFAPCIALPVVSGATVPFAGTYLGGTLPSEPGTDFCTLLNITSDMISTSYYKNGTVLDRFIEIEYSIFRMGKEHLRVEYVHPLHPNVTYVEVLDTTDAANPVSFHYNVDTYTKGVRIDTASSDVEVPVFVGPVYYYNSSFVTEQNLLDQALSSPFDYLGTTFFQGEEVRIWALHLNNHTVHATWYDSVSTQTVRRISYGDFGMMDVTAVIQINDTEVSAMNYLFQDPAKGVTVIVNGTTNDLPEHVGINPYQPFVRRYRDLLIQQNRLQPSDLDDDDHRRLEQEGAWEDLERGRSLKSAGTARARTSERRQDELGEYWVDLDVPVVVPPELLIPDAHLQRRPSSVILNEPSRLQLQANVPTRNPTRGPTKAPTKPPSAAPSFSPSAKPTPVPTRPTPAPSAIPTAQPSTRLPTPLPTTSAPTTKPTFKPTSNPTVKPTYKPSALPTRSPTHYCPSGWIGRADTCYYFQSLDWQDSWTDCRNLCQSKGATMLCIKDAVENKFIFDTIKKLAADRGTTGRDTWIGMYRNSDNEYVWFDGCETDLEDSYIWGENEPSVKDGQKYVAMDGDGGNGGKWKDDKNDESYRCACQNPYNPTARPTSRPPTRTPTRAPTGPSARPTNRPTRKPSTRPSVVPTLTVATRFPTRDGESREDMFLDLPQLSPFPSEINLISSFVYSKLGCLADNKCTNEVLWFQSFNAPFLPVLSVYGNYQIPCTFASVISEPNPIPLIPCFEIQIETAIEISFCNDFSALDYILGSVTVSVAVTGVDFVPAPFDEIFSYQIANAGIGVTFLVVEWWCEIDNANNIKYSNAEAYGLLRNLAQESRGPQMCRCLKAQQTYPGILNVVGGPDVPCIILAVLLPFSPLAPFLALMRIRQSSTLETYPNVCELAIARTTLSVDIHLNMGIFIYTVTVYSSAEKHASKSGSANFVGAYSEDGTNLFVSEAQFIQGKLMGPFTKAANSLLRLINKGNIVWSTIVSLGGALADAAKTYFQLQIAGGTVAADAVSAYARDLYKTFKPPPVVISGCFKIRFGPPRCRRHIRIFGHSICIRYSMPTMHCGATTKCIKYCD